MLRGFTLAELLISLAILGVIATFTIPKVLVAQQGSQYSAITKEAMATISGAYQAYLSTTPNPPTTMLPYALTNYMNYVSIDTTATIDDKNKGGSLTCTASNYCLRLHNGAVLKPAWVSFTGTESTNAIEFYIDPDGTYSNTTNGPGKSVQIFLYYNGRITSRDNVTTNTIDSAGTYNPYSGYDPTWFTWN